jgi:type I restriction enzyme S subunit
VSDLEQKRREVRQRLIDENEFPHIPQDWGVERLRFLFTESKERNGKSPVGEMLSVSEYRGVVPREYENEEQKRTDEELENYRIVRPGQLAVNSMWLNHLGLGVSEHTGHVSPAYNVYDISDRLDRRFVHHLMRSNYYLKIYLRYLYGIRPNSFQIKSNDWASIPIIVPDLATQRQIADCLDRETARIDLLIEKKQRLVALLEEKRSAIITDAVTKGGDRRSVARGGGVTTHRLKHFLERNDGGCWGEDPTGIGDTVVLRSTEQSSSGAWRINDPAVRQIFASDRKSKTIDLDDIIITKSSGSADHIGKASIADQSIAELEAVYSNFMQRIRVNSKASARYVWHLLNSSFARYHYNVYATSTSGLGNLNGGIIGNLPFPISDLATQRQIVDFLDHETARIVTVKERTNASIDRLKEYRSALITAAVTGQIDVSTYDKSGNPDRRLDAIQEEMGA